MSSLIVSAVTSQSLLTGAVVAGLDVVAVVGGLWLVVTRVRRHYAFAVPLSLVVGAALAYGLYLVVEKVWRPLPEPLPVSLFIWAGVALVSIVLAPWRIAIGPHLRTVGVTVVAVAAVVLGCAVQINLVFAAYPTVGDAFGVPAANAVNFGDLPGPTPTTVTGRPLESVWQVPPDMPTSGRVSAVPIPGVRSGFATRPARIYLPPSYFASPRPLLPVLVLLAGQPGDPADWVVGGRLATIMDSFARAHNGLAPVVVVADGTGTRFANPLCADTPRGQVATYLTQDIPAWITGHLQVDPDPRHWAIGGLSYGGTCALQLAAAYPQIYPTFIDISGQREPTLGSRDKTVHELFGGDAAAFARINPLDLLSKNKFPDSAGAFVVGTSDGEYRPGMIDVAAAAAAAGMKTRYDEVPGGHSFTVWSAGLELELPWLATRLELTG